MMNSSFNSEETTVEQKGNFMDKRHYIKKEGGAILGLLVLLLVIVPNLSYPFNIGTHPWHLQTGENLDKGEFEFDMFMGITQIIEGINYEREMFFPAMDWKINNIYLHKGWRLNIGLGSLFPLYPNLSLTRQLTIEKGLIPDISFTAGAGWSGPSSCIFTTFGIGKGLPFGFFSFLPHLREEKDRIYTSISCGYSAGDYTDPNMYFGGTNFRSNGMYYELILGYDVIWGKDDDERRNVIGILKSGFGVKTEFYPSGYLVNGKIVYNTGIFFFARPFTIQPRQRPQDKRDKK